MKNQDAESMLVLAMRLQCELGSPNISCLCDDAARGMSDESHYSHVLRESILDACEALSDKLSGIRHQDQGGKFGLDDLTVTWWADNADTDWQVIN